MAETLGSRIMEAAFRWQFERALNGMEAGRAEYDALAALCARADAAERGMVARVAFEDISADLREAAFYDTATKALVKRRRAAEAEDAEALAAWRALGEVTDD